MERIYEEHWRTRVQCALAKAADPTTGLPSVHRFYAANFMVWWYLDAKPAVMEKE